MNAPKKYTKKPVTIEAMLFDGSNGEMHAVYKWVEANTQGSYDYTGDERPEHGVSIDPTDGAFVIHTLEGEMRVSKGDYVIRGVQASSIPASRTSSRPPTTPLPTAGRGRSSTTRSARRSRDRTRTRS